MSDNINEKDGDGLVGLKSMAQIKRWNHGNNVNIGAIGFICMMESRFRAARLNF